MTDCVYLVRLVVLRLNLGSVGLGLLNMTVCGEIRGLSFISAWAGGVGKSTGGGYVVLERYLGGVFTY